MEACLARLSYNCSRVYNHSPALLRAHKGASGPLNFAVQGDVIGTWHARIFMSCALHSLIQACDSSSCCSIPQLLNIKGDVMAPGSFNGPVRDAHYSGNMQAGRFTHSFMHVLLPMQAWNSDSKR